MLSKTLRMIFLSIPFALTAPAANAADRTEPQTNTAGGSCYSKQVISQIWRIAMKTKLTLSAVGMLLIVGLFGVTPGIAAEQLAGQDGSSLQTIELPSTSTIIISRDPGTSAATKGEAFFCEGEKPNNYHCSNSYASYGCSEECKCCYYEEKMVEEQDVNTTLQSPRGQ